MNNYKPGLDDTCEHCGEFLLTEEGKLQVDYDYAIEPSWDDHRTISAPVFFHTQCPEVKSA